MGGSHELLFKALAEVSGTLSSIDSVPEQLKGDVLESSKQTVDYNVNKFLMKDASNKEAVLKWSQELKSFLRKLPPNASVAPVPAAVKSSPPAVFVLEDSARWTLKGHKKSLNSESELLEPTEVTLNQSVNVYDSSGAVIKVSSKCKSALVENCSELGLIVHSVVSGVEIVNSRKCQVQFEGQVPSVTIDSCDDITIFISEETLKAVQIYTSKVSQVNIKVLSCEGDLLREFAVPEQFKTAFVNGKLETLPLAHAGV